MSHAAAIASPDTIEFVDARPAVHVQEAEYLRLLGYPKDFVPGERARELMAWARAWYAEHGRPWIFARGAGGVMIGADKISIDGTDFVSERLRAQFFEAQAHDAVLVAVSAGRECETQARECWAQGKPDEYFFLEMFGTAVVEYLVTQAAARVCAWSDQRHLAVLPHYSPGYTGWPVTDQLKLWQLIRGDVALPFPADLEILESGMLRPKKSLLTVFGLTRHPEKVKARLIPCENCSLPGCQYRRAAYRHHMPQTETFAPRQNNFVDTPAATPAPALDLNARYSTNTRALRKWSQERLHLTIESDGSVNARFQHDGTTCSNLGQPIQYEYHVRLQSPGYRIAEARCAPTPGDLGHMSMCEYLKDPGAFMNRVASEKPLLNRPLNDVLTWTRSANPAGCHCEAESREHKWGMVFEVIHFALAQNEKQKTVGQTLPVPEKSV